MVNMRNGLIAGAFGLLTIVAIAGWARKPGGSGNDQPFALNSAGNTQPVAYDQNGQPVYGGGSTSPVSVNEPCVPAGSPAGSSPVNSSPVGYQPAVYGTPYRDDRYMSDQYVRSIHRPVRVVSNDFATRDTPVVRENVVREDNSREYVTTRNGRTKTKSALIVAGSAGTGAAIGAIAGGGKGAGIGALSGGAAGFIYDRLTHNHR